MKRSRVRAKRFDVHAIVTKPDGESSHYEIVTDGSGAITDILVDVVTVPDQLDLTCRLAGLAVDHGLITIPAEGDEVIVDVPAGEIEFSPTIVALCSTGAIPNPSGQGPATGRTIIVNGEVFIHDGSGGAEPLITKSQYDAHKHPTGTGPSGVPDNIATSGTTVLKAK